MMRTPQTHGGMRCDEMQRHRRHGGANIAQQCHSAAGEAMSHRALHDGARHNRTLPLHSRRCQPKMRFALRRALPPNPICIYNTPSDGLLRNKVNYQKYTEVCQ